MPDDATLATRDASPGQSAPRVMGLDHVVLRVADIDRSIAFYEAVLGLHVERRLAEIGLVQLRAGTSMIDLVLGERALRVGGVVRGRRRLCAVAIAAQIGNDQGEVLRQARRHLAPQHMGLRIAVQQQQRRPAAAGHQVYLGARSRDPPLFKTRKEIGHAKFHSKAVVTPAEAGVQGKRWCLGPLDSRFRGNDA